MTTLPFYPGIDLDLSLQQGFPAVHEAYRPLQDQKDMVCGAYVIAYLLVAYGATDDAAVDRVAAVAGTALEPHNNERANALREQVKSGEIPAMRMGTWAPHDHYQSLAVDTEEGGTSPEGLVRACEEVSGERVAAIPVPAVVDEETQLTPERFDNLLSGVLEGRQTVQLVFNYNLSSTLAPAGLLGHKYSLTALLTKWDDPEYFRRVDWNVGHFTNLAGRLAREDSERRYLLIRDSYKSFGWNGYHLQPEENIRHGIVRANDDRDGGVLLVVPSDEHTATTDWLSDLGLETGLWDNGSASLPNDD